MQTDSLLWEWIKSSKRKHIAIKIDAEGRVFLRTPQRCSLKKAEAVIVEKMGWIITSIAKQKKRIHPKFPEYQQEGKLFYLGELYDFVLIGKSSQKVELFEGRFVIVADTEKQFKKNLQAWYKEKTMYEVERSLEYFKSISTLEPQSISYRVYKSRWAACTHDDHLKFNALLSLHKVEHIHYVVAHELTHMIEKNHSKAFYEEGEKLLDNFRVFDKQMRI